MVLQLNGRPVEFNQSELKALLHDQTCTSEAYKFHRINVQKIETNKNLIFLHQREMAIISLFDPAVCFLGTDDTTTCHFVVLDCQNAGLVGAAHLDGCGTDIFFSTFVNRVRREFDNFIYLKGLKRTAHSNEDDLAQPENKSQFEITVHLAGGFLDDDNSSETLSKDILTILANEYEDMTFRLSLCCITDLNNHRRKGLNFPIHYGFIYNSRIHTLSPATFSDNAKEPMSVLRSTRFCCERTLYNVYNTEEFILEIRDFEYTGKKNRVYYYNLSQAADSVLTQYSTSPQQEKEGYATRLRKVFKLMYEHPEPRLSLYDGEYGIRFRCNPKSGDWERIK